MNPFDEKLTAAIKKGLKKAEDNNDIVISTMIMSNVTSIVVEEIKKVYSGGTLTPNEILGICLVLEYASKDKAFYDWEMPTLSGYKAKEMEELATKLRKSVGM